MLSNAELDFMRKSINQLLPDVCNILTATNTPDGMGGNTQSWGTTYARVPCRLDDKASPMPVIGGGVQIYSSFMLSLPYDTVIVDTNRVEVNGVTFAITAINDNQSWNAVKRVNLVEL